MEQRTKFTDEELDHTPIINVIEFDLITNNGVVYADMDHFHGWNAWDDRNIRYLPPFIKVYSIYPDVDLFKLFKDILPETYFLWGANEYHYTKKEW